MKVKEGIPEPSKRVIIKKLRAKIKSKSTNPTENQPSGGWNRDPHQGSVPGTFLNR